MSLPNPLEQQMLGLINQERADADLAPLTFNGDLNDASEDHSAWMLDTDTFSHTGQNGSSAGDRIVAAGYELEGNWTWGENIGWQSERGAPGLEDDVADIHQSLMNSPGHRANILNPAFDEIGIGIENGDFESFDSVMITQNFGATDAVSDDPDTLQPPATEDPVGETPVDEDPPVAEEPDPETPPEEEPPVADDPDGETPDEEETPVAEGPDAETPEGEEPPLSEEPDHEPFDVEQFLADLSDMLEELFDGFEFIALNECETDGMGDGTFLIDDMPMNEDTSTDGDDRVVTCGDWPGDGFEFEVSDSFTHNFDLA